MDAKTWAGTALAKVLASCRREVAFELARWALVLRRER